jgi:hypothetical protein
VTQRATLCDTEGHAVWLRGPTTENLCGGKRLPWLQSVVELQRCSNVAFEHVHGHTYCHTDREMPGSRSRKGRIRSAQPHGCRSLVCRFTALGCARCGRGCGTLPDLFLLHFMHTMWERLGNFGEFSSCVSCTRYGRGWGTFADFLLAFHAQNSWRCGCSCHPVCCRANCCNSCLRLSDRWVEPLEVRLLGCPHE